MDGNDLGPTAGARNLNAGEDDTCARIFKSDDLASSKLDRPDATHLPAALYTSEDVFKREKELLFFRDWIVVARDDEFKEPGDYRTFDMAGERFIIVRDRAGALKAFINSCRHRGTPVAHGQGNTSIRCGASSWAISTRRLAACHPSRSIRSPVSFS